MTVIAQAPAERVTNEHVELARYSVSVGERVICGQRVPAAGPCCLLADLREQGR